MCVRAFGVDLFQTACRHNHYHPIRQSEELQGWAAHLWPTLSTPVQRAAPPLPSHLRCDGKVSCAFARVEIQRENGGPKKPHAVTASIVWACVRVGTRSEPSVARNKVAPLLLTVFFLIATWGMSVISSVCPRQKSIARPCPSSVSVWGAAAWATHLRSNYPDSFCMTGTGSCSLFTLLHIPPPVSAFTDIYTVSRYATHIYTYIFRTSFPHTA